MDPIGLTVTSSSILFGFLFAGFWWALNRELKFPPGGRHLQPGYFLLFLTMATLAFFGILQPLRAAVTKQPLPTQTILGLITVFVGIFGYMLTTLAHYSVFQYPKYKTKLESAVFGIFLLALIVLLVLALK